MDPKVGFCLTDNLPVDHDRAPPEPIYFGCEAEVQGNSVGYGDLYAAELFEQDLNVSHLPDGRYRLLNVANPDGVIRDRDHGNNVGWVDILLREGVVVLAPTRKHPLTDLGPASIVPPPASWLPRPAC